MENKKHKLAKFAAIGVIAAGLATAGLTGCAQPASPETVINICGECGQNHTTDSHQKIDITDVVRVDLFDTTDYTTARAEYFGYVQNCLDSIVADSAEALNLTKSSNIYDKKLKSDFVDGLEFLSGSGSYKALDDYVEYFSHHTSIMIAHFVRDLSETDKEKFKLSYQMISAEKYLDIYRRAVSNVKQETNTYIELEETIRPNASVNGITDNNKEQILYSLLPQISANTGLSDHTIRKILKTALTVDAPLYSLMDDIYSCGIIPTSRPDVYLNPDLYEPFMGKRTGEYLWNKIETYVSTLEQSENITPLLSK